MSEPAIRRCACDNCMRFALPGRTRCLWCEAHGCGRSEGESAERDQVDQVDQAPERRAEAA